VGTSRLVVHHGRATIMFFRSYKHKKSMRNHPSNLNIRLYKTENVDNIVVNVNGMVRNNDGSWSYP
jgi:hypothetical protein